MSKLNLYSYQKIGVFRGTQKFKGRVLIADDPGLGKTCQSLHIASHFYDGEHPIIVVCPASVKYQWELEVHKTMGWQSWILNGLKPPTRMPLHIPPVIIINYDILRGGWTDRLISLKPQIVIGDESSAIKDSRAQRTKAFKRLCTFVPHVILLTGTPIENGPIDFFTSLNLLRKDIFPSFRQFAFRYSNFKITPWGIKFEGSKNTLELNKLILDTVMIRRKKEDVLKDLPPITRIIIPQDIDRKEYKEAEEDFITWLFKNKPNKAIKMVYSNSAIQLTKLTYLLGLIAKLKTPSVIRWIEDFLEDTDKKLVVFGHHRAFLEELHAKFKDQSVLVYGGVSVKERTKLIDRFAADKKVRIFFGSILAAGVGINKLQTVCSDVVMGELVWTSTKILQAEGRLHRIGQKNPVSVYYLIAKDTMESILCRAIHTKQTVINQIVDGSEANHEFDILTDVFSELRKRRT